MLVEVEFHLPEGSTQSDVSEFAEAQEGLYQLFYADRQRFDLIAGMIEGLLLLDQPRSVKA